jgi:hypothetical protein
MDFSFLSTPTPAPSLPDPVEEYQRTLTLKELARRDRENALVETQKVDLDTATKAAQQIFKRAQEVGWDAAIEEGAQINPQGAQIALKAYKEQQGIDNEQTAKLSTAMKARADAAKTTTENTNLIAERFSNEARYLSQKPNLSPDDVATFMKKVATNNMQTVLTPIPFQKWTDPQAARDGLAQASQLFYNTKDKVTADDLRQKDLYEHQDRGVVADQTKVRDATTAKHYANEDYDRSQRLAWDKEKFDKSKQEEVPLTEGGMAVATEMMRAGKTPPAGWGQGGRSRANGFLNAMAEDIYSKGGTPGDGSLVGGISDFKASSSALTQIEKDLTTLRPYANMLDRNTQVLDKLAEKVTKTDSSLINKPINWIAQHTGDPDTATFLAQMRLWQTEAARVIQNPRLTGVLTVDAQRELDKVVNGDLSLAQTKAVLKLVGGDAHARIAKMEGESENRRGEIRSRVAGPKPGGTDGSVPLPQAPASDGWGKVETVR